MRDLAVTAAITAALLTHGVHADQTARFSGHVSQVPAGAVVELQSASPATPHRWRTVDRAASGAAGAFTLSWKVPFTPFVDWRVALVQNTQILAATATYSLHPGVEESPCPAVAPPSLPPGDGWVSGGLYLAGGPAPGIFGCMEEAYALTVASRSGGSVTQLRVGAHHAFVLALAPGRYTLSTSRTPTPTTVTITAGRETRVELVDPVP